MVPVFPKKQFGISREGLSAKRIPASGFTPGQMLPTTG